MKTLVLVVVAGALVCGAGQDPEGAPLDEWEQVAEVSMNIGGVTIWYVDDDNCPAPGSGTEADPFCLIQDCIDAAMDGDTVLVADGTYTGEGNRDLDFGGKAITVRSENGPGACTIDIQGSDIDPHRAFHFHSGESAASIVKGFTIANGEMDNGGAILIENDSSPTIMSCSFEGNTANEVGGRFGGGAVRIDGGQPTFANCGFIGNYGWGGGALLARADAYVTLRACAFQANSADGGGGVGAFENTVIDATDCSFIDNVAWEGGGAVVIEATFTNCLFRFNWAVGETMGAHAGAILGQSVVITNSTFWNNGPNQISPPLPSHPAVCVDSVMTVSNSILWCSNYCTQIRECFGGSIEAVSYSNIEGGWAGEGNIDADPLFVDPDNGDFHLSAGSPCIDAADNTAVPEGIVTDLDGNPRFVDDPNTDDTGFGDPPIVDMGTYELQDPCADDDGDGRVTICHIPPGNPANAHTITVSVNALRAHLAHGDYCGPCEGDPLKSQEAVAQDEIDARESAPVLRERGP